MFSNLVPSLPKGPRVLRWGLYLPSCRKSLGNGCWLRTLNELINLVVPHGLEIGCKCKKYCCALRKSDSAQRYQGGHVTHWTGLSPASRASWRLRGQAQKIQISGSGRLWAYNQTLLLLKPLLIFFALSHLVYLTLWIFACREIDKKDSKS